MTRSSMSVVKTNISHISLVAFQSSGVVIKMFLVFTLSLNLCSATVVALLFDPLR